MYKYLLWDIDGTILDFKVSEAYAIRTLFRNYNLGECDDEKLNMYSKINAQYWEALEKKQMTKAEILVERFQTFFKKIGVDTALAPIFNREYQEALGDCIAFVPHAMEMLLAEKGSYTLLAVTNGTKIAQDKKLRLAKLDTLFDGIHISEDIGAEKPSTTFFNHVFKMEGICDKSQALIIGDSLTSDIQGGINAGIDTCWFNPSHKENIYGIVPTYEIHSLKQMEMILKGGF